MWDERIGTRDYDGTTLTGRTVLGLVKGHIMLMSQCIVGWSQYAQRKILGSG